MKYFINTLVTILLIIVFSAIAVTLLGYRFQTISDRDKLAMYPTIESGDLFLFKTNYDSSSFNRGDIVIIKNSHFLFPIVRRIIGLENDRIQIVNGNIYLNNNILDEPYSSTLSVLDSKTEAKNYFVQFEPEIIVPHGKVYVVGDNRVNSNDSRNKDFGLIDAKGITGHVTFILFSDHFSKIGTVH